MEAEERSRKLRKLTHDVNDQQPSASDTVLEKLPSDVVEDDEKETVKNEPVIHGNGASADSSSVQIIQKDTAEPVSTSESHVPTSDQAHNPTCSKNQLKKIRRKQEWEAGREERKLIRKQKTLEKKARKRAARNATAEVDLLTNDKGLGNGQDKSSRDSVRPGVPKQVSGILLPITLIIDCAFDNLMHERERISLGSQITRSYSDNHRAPFKAHLAISSWGGELKTRFDTVLSRHHLNWKGVRMLEEDFVEVAERSKEWMSSKKGGKLLGAFNLDAAHAQSAELGKAGEVVYLTSDSENTLDRLKPYSTYIIGGLVDKNRHKGICYKSACDRGIKTAKLPIGEYMDMQSRSVLATNHVVEIMIRWLECSDWGQAFLKVMPKRKGAKLKRTAGIPKDEHQKREEGGTGTHSDKEDEELGPAGQDLDVCDTRGLYEGDENSAVPVDPVVQ